MIHYATKKFWNIDKNNDDFAADNSCGSCCKNENRDKDDCDAENGCNVHCTTFVQLGFDNDVTAPSPKKQKVVSYSESTSAAASETTKLHPPPQTAAFKKSKTKRSKRFYTARKQSQFDKPKPRKQETYTPKPNEQY